MKKTCILLLLCLPITAFAQKFGGMNKEQMQQMMQQMQQLQGCMKQVDKSEMEALKQHAKEMSAEVKELCAAGKRDEARAKGLEFAKESAQSKAMQEIQKCGEGMHKMLPEIVAAAQQDGNGDNKSHAKHICDVIKD